MDLASTVALLRLHEFDVEFQPNQVSPADSAWVAVRNEGWFRTRIYLPVSDHSRPRLYIGLHARRAHDGHVFEAPSYRSVRSRQAAVRLALDFLSVVQVDWK